MLTISVCENKVPFNIGFFLAPNRVFMIIYILIMRHVEHLEIIISIELSKFF